MKNTRKLILITAFIPALAFTTHARDWSLSKDTVYEDFMIHDQIQLVNHGTDTLMIDSLFLEIIRPDMEYAAANFFVYPKTPGVPSYSANYVRGMSHLEYYRKPMAIPPGGVCTLKSFQIDWPLYPFPDPGAVAQKRDTIVSRLIIAGSSNQGRDTLFLIGIWNNR